MHYQMITGFLLTEPLIASCAEVTGIENMQGILLNLFFHFGEAKPDVVGPIAEDHREKLPLSIHSLYSIGESKINGTFMVQDFNFLLKLESGMLKSVSSRVYRSDMFQIKRLYYEYIPSSVDYVVIERCAQHYEIESRYLPRLSKFISLQSNKIFGTINLTTLPEKLEHFDISLNAIYGQIKLCSLPTDLKSLYLQSNEIEQETIYYENLPQGITIISLRGLKIKNILATDQSKRVNPGIFSVDNATRVA